jgi:hypothetical protein
MEGAAALQQQSPSTEILQLELQQATLRLTLARNNVNSADSAEEINRLTQKALQADIALLSHQCAAQAQAISHTSAISIIAPANANASIAPDALIMPGEVIIPADGFESKHDAQAFIQREHTKVGKVSIYS